MSPPPRNPRRIPAGSWTPRPLETPAPKLDPRLRYLLSFSFDELRDLQLREWSLLAPLERKIRKSLRALRKARSRRVQERRVAELKELHQQRFAPLTFGVHIPDPAQGTGMWAPGIDEVYFSGFVRAHTNVEGLEQLGAKARSKSRDVFTVFVPRSAVEKLEGSGAVRALELARPLFPSLDWTMTFTGMADIHDAILSPFKGTGVVVGIVDDSLDFYHPDFQVPGGAGVVSRVRFLWDQNVDPADLKLGDRAVGVDPPLPGFVLSAGTHAGAEYPDVAVAPRTSINWELDPSDGHAAHEIVAHDAYNFSAFSHGTAVTGCAAGNGRGSSKLYVGAAPGADILFVSYRAEKSLQGLGDSTAVMDGCNYIAMRAEQMNQPCVINLSLNDNLGPHDGSSPLEIFLDGLLESTPRRVITVSAGNSNSSGSAGFHKCHTSDTIPAGESRTVDLLYNSVVFFRSDAAEIWYDHAASFKLTVQSRDGAGVLSSVIPGLAPTADGNTQEAALPGGAVLTVTSKLASPSEPDRANQISFQIEVDSGETIPDLVITLENTSATDATFHGWIDRNNAPLSEWSPAVLDSSTIATPATAQYVIAVGAHLKDDPPTIAEYSGRGQTRDGRDKPEIATVGGDSLHYDYWTPMPRDLSVAAPGTSDLYSKCMGGTSWAAPVVAGACALLYECRGGTGASADLLADLGAAAGDPGAGAPISAWGRGYLQMATACAGKAAMAMWTGTDESDLEFVIPSLEPPFDARWWGSPDIRVILDERTVLENPFPMPAGPSEHRVQVTVRNSSRKELRDVAVEFYWADLATGLTSEALWSRDGISVPKPGGGATRGNVIRLDRIPRRSETRVGFLWSPPARGDRSRTTASFSLLARIVHGDRGGRTRPNGRFAVGMGEAIALRSLVSGKLDAAGSSSMEFQALGGRGSSSLHAVTHGVRGELALRVPVEALPWRDLEVLEPFLERHPAGRVAFGAKGPSDPLAKLANASFPREAIEKLTDVRGAETLVIDGGFATFVTRPGGSLRIPDLRVAPGKPMLVRAEVRHASLQGLRGFLHVAQFSEARAAGGVTLELLRDVARSPTGVVVP